MIIIMYLPEVSIFCASFTSRLSSCLFIAFGKTGLFCALLAKRYKPSLMHSLVFTSNWNNNGGKEGKLQNITHFNVQWSRTRKHCFYQYYSIDLFSPRLWPSKEIKMPRGKNVETSQWRSCYKSNCKKTSCLYEELWLEVKVFQLDEPYIQKEGRK